MDALQQAKVQLQEVRAMLLGDPGNAVLAKLANDLQALIELQSKGQGEASGAANVGGWKKGATCQAVYPADGLYYDAVIDAVTSDGSTASVTFDGYGNSEEILVSSLRARATSTGNSGTTGGAGLPQKRKHGDDATAAADGGMPPERPPGTKTKAQREEEREKKRMKETKRKEKMEQKEAERNDEKSKWQSFSSGKASTKSKSGFLSGKSKRSIFASPDDPMGKVGIGTCNIGGKGMTEFQARGKWSFKDGDDAPAPGAQ